MFLTPEGIRLHIEDLGVETGVLEESPWVTLICKTDHNKRGPSREAKGVKSENRVGRQASVSTGRKGFRAGASCPGPGVSRHCPRSCPASVAQSGPGPPRVKGGGRLQGSCATT